MSNLDNLQEKIKNKISDKLTNEELAVEVNGIKEVLNNLIELVKTRSF